MKTMFAAGWLKTSLARKVSLLFGTAVLLTITVTLVFPQLHMTALNEQAMLIQAKRIASVAYQSVDLQGPDWAAAESTLDERWPALVAEMGLSSPPPRLVSVGGHVGGGFQSEAVERLQANPNQRYYWRLQDNDRLFRFAMAIRGVPADAHPTALRGLIDVRIPTSRDADTWNLAVTVLAGASGCVLAILVFYIVTQRLVLTPVTTLRRVAEKVTRGDLEVRSAIDSGDEFEELSIAFNDMLTHLKSAQDEQRKINRSLDIRLGQLAESNVALYESNRLRSEFLANVTHELRTPLVSIIGFAELLRDAWQHPDTDRKRLARYCENILTSGRNLLEIINDLLDLAKAEAGAMKLHVSQFSIDLLCHDLIDFVQPLADKRNQRLVLEVAESVPRCRTDSGKVKQILYNLLSNAIKFTPTGGTVTLQVRILLGCRIELRVCDTGPGIPEDQREIIFEKFRQLDASKTREYEGTGLGLAITREIVKILGGEISVESRHGEGSTFKVVIPADVEKEPEPPCESGPGRVETRIETGRKVENHQRSA